MWEYLVLYIFDNGGVSSISDSTYKDISEAGKDGWELVSVAFEGENFNYETTASAFFKRPIQPRQPV